MNPFDIIIFVFLIFWSMVAIFVICELGQRLTNTFDSFNDTLYQSNWYSFPIEIRRTFTIVLTNAQKPVIVQGYASTFCVREYFRLVIVHFFLPSKFKYQIKFLLFFRALDHSEKLLLFHFASSNKLSIKI